MFERDQPVVADLAIAVCNANHPIDRTTLLIGSGDALETMAKCNVAADGNAKIGDNDLRCTPEM